MNSDRLLRFMLLSMILATTIVTVNSQEFAVNDGGSRLDATATRSIQSIDLSDSAADLGAVAPDTIIVRFRSEEAATLHGLMLAERQGAGSRKIESDALAATMSMPAFVSSLKPFVSGAAKIDSIVRSNPQASAMVKSGTQLSAAGMTALRIQTARDESERGPVGLFYAKLKPGTDLRAACLELMRRPDVVYANPVPISRAAGVPNDPLYGRMWHLSRINMPAAWDRATNTPAGVRVCVVDTGVRITHNELAGRIADPVDLYLVNGDAYGNADPDDDDLDGHGTAVAGIIAGIRDNASLIAGVAPVTIIPVNVGEDNGDLWNYDEGVYWGVDHQAAVINLSLGGYRDNPYPSELDAAAYAETHGVVVVASAGNDETSTDNHYPSAIPYYISVGAVGDDDVRVQAANWGWGSNYGNTLDISAPGAGSVGANGDSILTLDRGSNDAFQNDFGGTSASAPLVSGLCALLKHVKPGLTAAEVRSIVEATAQDQIGDTAEDTPGWDPYHGHGLINSTAAIAAALNVSAPSTTLYIYDGALDAAPGYSSGWRDGTYIAPCSKVSRHAVSIRSDMVGTDYSYTAKWIFNENAGLVIHFRIILAHQGAEEILVDYPVTLPGGDFIFTGFSQAGPDPAAHPGDTLIFEVDIRGYVGSYSSLFRPNFPRITVPRVITPVSRFLKHSTDISDFPTTLAAADLDGDGDIDLVGSQYPFVYGYELAWWENDGQQQFAKHVVDTNFCAASLSILDVDGDQAPDILGAGEMKLSEYFVEEQVAWFQNNHDGTFTKHPIKNNLGTVNTIVGGDLDKDGDTDVIVGSELWFENNGSQAFTLHSIDTSWYSSWVQLIDLDQDGDVDLAGASWYGGIAWWENQGNQTFIRHDLRIPPLIHTNGLRSAACAVDFDGDGDIDILGTAAVDAEIAWWENDGYQGMTKHLVEANAGDSVYIHAGDMDGDGDLDILTPGSSLRWWENAGEGDLIRRKIGNGYATYALAIDMNQDGALDLVGGRQEIAPTWWENCYKGPINDMDVDGDSVSDISVWRPESGTWYVLPSNSPGSSEGTPWGIAGDMPVPGDYDGDGKSDTSVWRPATGIWYILSSTDPGSYTAIQWGLPSDIPVLGDYDGDDIDDIAVWRPDTGTWYVLPSSTPGSYTDTQWGLAGDIPVPGDYDADGKTDIAVWRPDEGVWYVLPSSEHGTYLARQWGLPTDIPTPADYDNDGRTDMAVWRSDSGIWYVLPSADPGSYTETQWGMPGDIPVGGDYDGDGKADVAVWRPGEGVWYVLLSGSPGSHLAIQWGSPTDVSISSVTGILRSAP